VAEVEDPAVEEDAGIEVEGPAEEEDAGIQTEEEPLEGASESAEPTFDELSTPEEQSDDVSDTQTPDESPVQDGDSCRELDEETRATVAREAMIPGTLAAWMVRMKKLIVPGATGENADGELPAEGAESASATQPDSEQGDAVQLDELGQSYEDEADASELDSLYEDAADEGELDPLYEDAADEGEVFADDTTVLPPVPAPSSTPAASSAPAADDVSSDPSATSRLSSAGQRARLTFTRQGVQVLRLEQGTKAISRSLRSARSTIDTFNAGERVDPTKPAIITLAVGVLVATVIAATTLFGGAPDLSFRRQAPVAAPTPVETETAQPTETPEAPSSVAPQIASVEVISVDNDGGDHPEWVEYMLDGDTSTHWQSRYFGVSELPEGNTVRLVIKLKEAAPVSEVVLTGPVEGGQVDLRVNDGSDPFGTKVLTSSKMSETTSLKPSEATEGTTVTLNFYALPVDDEGSLRVKVSTLTVK
ncbi:MAG: hypothetical protein Q4P06_04055, partial [Actinomycetaceae bacterium]|nr:hypothetical protein [Actinomycetaceae bacterium]